MRYTVVILTYNDRSLPLQTCVGKIGENARTPAADREIIIVSNGNGPETATVKWLSDSWLMSNDRNRRALMLEKNEGVCARNYGIDAAKGEIIIQIDDDVLVTPRFDEILLAPFQDPAVGATGQHGFYQEQTWRKLIDDRRRPRAGQYADLLMGFCWAWRNIRVSQDRAVRGDGLAAIDISGPSRFLYDTDFNPFWHEESDIQMQIRHAGYRLAVTPEIAVHRTMHDWKETHADGPVTGLTIAKRNFYRLEDKWKDKGLPFEGPRVGLRGPDLRGRTPRRDRDDFAGKAVE